jgi:hypothetical protein
MTNSLRKQTNDHSGGRGLPSTWDTFKGIANAQLGSSDTILFWDDMWNG